MGSERTQETGAAAPRAPWLVRSTSPLHCVLAFALGAWMQHALGLPLPPEHLRGILHGIGTMLANAGLLMVLWAFALLAWSRTAMLPGGSPVRLVLGGPFRVTRNPVYVGMIASYVGLAFMLDLPWTLAWLPLPLWGLQRAVVPYEEMRLRRQFGAEYERYCARVRRWL